MIALLQAVRSAGAERRAPLVTMPLIYHAPLLQAVRSAGAERRARALPFACQVW